MKVKELIKALKFFNTNAKIVFAGDEELNIISTGGQVQTTTIYPGGDDDGKDVVVVYPLSGTEIEEENGN